VKKERIFVQKLHHVACFDVLHERVVAFCCMCLIATGEAECVFSSECS